MINRSDVTSAGRFIKTHGIKGELNAVLDIDVEFLESERCFICEIDGILVPFYIENIRPKGAHGVLIKPEDIENEQEAQQFVGCELFVSSASLKSYERETYGHDSDEEGEFADDLIGWNVIDADSELEIGKIAGLNLDTTNAIFFVETPQKQTVLIPVCDEFITEMNADKKTVAMRLPEGLLHLNN